MKSKIVRLLVLMVLIFTGLISYILWSEKSRISSERTQSIQARVAELSERLSLPVKVFDVAGIHDAVSKSTLKDFATRIDVNDKNGELVYSSNPNALACPGQKLTNEILYSGFNNGTLSICLEKVSPVSDRLFWTILMVCFMALMSVAYIVLAGVKLTNKLVKVDQFIKRLDPDKPMSMPLPKNFADADLHPIYQSIYSLIQKIEKHEQKIKDLKVHEEVSNEARGVAHDIRSPLSEIKVVLDFDNTLSQKTRNHIIGSVTTIERISKELLKKYNVQDISEDELDIAVQSLTEMWEKKKLVLSKENIKFEQELGWDSMAEIENPITLKRTISNIINNSVEAIGEKTGKVILQTHKMGERVIIRLMDTGPGIDPSIIAKLGQQEVTTKADGNGIGLLRAKEYIESIKGTIEFENTQAGASVFIQVPVGAS